MSDQAARTLVSVTLETFAPRVGERFRISAGEGTTIDAALIEAAPLGASARGGRQPFSLIFLGPAAPVWPQRIYRVDHRALGSLDLFLVPIGPRDGGMQYEAIFS
jgi:hypothetical protein